MRRLLKNSILLRMLAVLVTLCVLDGPIAMVQVFAWARMAVIYSGESGLATGIRDTFSGEKPCKYCKAIQAGNPDGEDRPDAVRTGRPLSVELLATADLEPDLPLSLHSVGVIHPTFILNTAPDHAPPVPPPRVV